MLDAAGIPLTPYAGLTLPGAWTPDRIETLKSLWQDGLSGALIAAHLGGVTRNAVIGKLHRLGLTGRGQPQSAMNRKRRSRPHMHRQDYRDSPIDDATQEPRRLRAKPSPVTLVAKPERIHFMDLPAGRCVYPLWSEFERSGDCCGAPNRDADTNYCEAHHVLTHSRPMTAAEADRIAAAEIKQAA